MKRYAYACATRCRLEWLWDSRLFYCGQMSRSSNRSTSANPREVTKVMHTNDVVCPGGNEGHIMPRHFFLQYVRVSATAYIEVLGNDAALNRGGNCTCSSKTIHITQKSLIKNFHDHDAPAYSFLNLLIWTLWTTTPRTSLSGSLTSGPQIQGLFDIRNCGRNDQNKWKLPDSEM